MAAPEEKLPRKLWEHPNPQSTNMWRFIQTCNARYGLKMSTFQDLYKWSVGESRNDFWNALWSEIRLIHEGSYSRPVDPDARMDSIPEWFKGVRLNFAENILYTRGETKESRTTWDKSDDKVACTEVREGGTEVKDYTWRDLRRKVALLANAMQAQGVKKGDRVAVVASNSFDTLCVFLAVTSLGGLFSSSSTDMGTKGILDRLLQIDPVYVFFDDWAVYNGKTTDLRPKIRDILSGLAPLKNFKGVVTMPRFTYYANVSGLPNTVTLNEFLVAARGDYELRFERVEYRDPFLVVYSSGTTGVPKCIVHSVGGVLTSSMKEGKLHRDLGPQTVQLQYTTTGWIMYMSAVLSMLAGARAVLYDGSPFQPDLTAFIKVIGEQKVTNLGISPRYMHELQKNNVSPREVTDLSSLQSCTSTGMVLKDQLFEWFYDVGFPPHVQLANISGGTDLAGCFGMENPLTPVYVGGCQGPSIGTAIAVYDQTIEGGKGVKGVELEDGTPGELVAPLSFPNQPVFFWGADGAQKYYNSYFARFDDVWTHGDFIMIHPITKQIFFLGRADGVLNPSGVRFGSAEIYNVVEQFFPQVQDSICVGQRRPNDHDETVLLFLLMAPGHKFSQQLAKDVQAKIGQELSKRHVPKHVFETPEIPTTINLKKVELPVKQIVSGHTVKPSSTLMNPDSLKYYYQFADIEKLLEQGSVKSRL
ncbi:acetoacetate-CoA ligase [Verruconis gallopava]|uniref:Acetoacetate-CoA ligase n=1 Tax=Verruconis gallopava TaxID=253628 RepID=A0A0D1XX35_9PEZI|nr:acetoacetate-CoA ligase [Verruconis gallopava]KIW07361.1 acetoacetate-CoA ligase [Verruconis gallopava]